jgi:hypothetical protein
MTDEELNDRAKFNDEVTRKANWLLAELTEKVAEGKIGPGVAICSLMVAAVNLAQLHGTGPEVASWLRSQIPNLEAMIATADERPN